MSDSYRYGDEVRLIKTPAGDSTRDSPVGRVLQVGVRAGAPMYTVGFLNSTAYDVPEAHLAPAWGEVADVRG